MRKTNKALPQNIGTQLCPWSPNKQSSSSGKPSKWKH